MQIDNKKSLRKNRRDRLCAKHDVEQMLAFLEDRADYVIEKLELKHKQGQKLLSGIQVLKTEWESLDRDEQHQKLTALLSAIDGPAWPKVKANFRRYKHARATRVVYLPTELIDAMHNVPGDGYIDKTQYLIEFFSIRTNQSGE